MQSLETASNLDVHIQRWELHGDDRGVYATPAADLPRTRYGPATDPPRTRHGGPATAPPRPRRGPATEDLAADQPRPITDHGSQYSHDVPPLGIIQQLTQLQEELDDPLRDEDLSVDAAYRLNGWNPQNPVHQWIDFFMVDLVNQLLRFNLFEDQ